MRNFTGGARVSRDPTRDAPHRSSASRLSASPAFGVAAFGFAAFGFSSSPPTNRAIASLAFAAPSRPAACACPRSSRRRARRPCPRRRRRCHSSRRADSWPCRRSRSCTVLASGRCSLVGGRYGVQRRTPSVSRIGVRPDRRDRGGGSGIRTHGDLRLNGFQDRPVRPLRHPSSERGAGYATARRGPRGGAVACRSNRMRRFALVLLALALTAAVGIPAAAADTSAPSTPAPSTPPPSTPAFCRSTDRLLLLIARTPDPRQLDTVPGRRGAAPAPRRRAAQRRGGDEDRRLLVRLPDASRRAAR